MRKLTVFANDKTNKMACAPSEDSDQPEHPPSLIRVFAVRMKKPWVLSEDSDQTGRTPILLVLSCRGSYMALEDQISGPTDWLCMHI